MGQIEIRFQEVMILAQQLAAESSGIQKAAESILQDNISLKAAWQSESADLFSGKEVKLSEQIVQEATLLKKLSKELEERAREMYLAECTNNLRAKTRIYL